MNWRETNELQRLARERAALLRRLSVANMDVDSAERAQARIAEIECRGRQMLVTKSSGFDVVI